MNNKRQVEICLKRNLCLRLQMTKLLRLNLPREEASEQHLLISKVEEQKIKNRKNSAVWHAKWISKGVPREGQEGNGGEASQQELEGGEASQQELEGGEVAPQNSEPSSASASEPSIDPDMMNEANVLV